LNESDKPRSRAHLITMRYRFPKGAKGADGRAMSTIEIREVDTHDIATAAKVADANKSDVQLEQLAVAVVAVDGQPLVTGSVEGWNAVAIEFALRAYHRLNGLSQSVVEELLDAGEPVPAR
jgi:hypothetical protein